MKKFFYLLIGVISLLAACTAEPAMDTTAAIYADTDKVIADINERSSGTFDMAWIVDKQIVDTATLYSKDNNIVISHFPIRFFLELDYINHSVSYNGSYPVDYPEGWNPTYVYAEESNWCFNTSFVGFSTSNAYFSNSPSSSVLSPKTEFLLDGKKDGFQAYFSNDAQNGLPISLMYDVTKDVWSGSVLVDSCKFASDAGEGIQRYSPPLTLSFQTTGRKQK